MYWLTVYECVTCQCQNHPGRTFWNNAGVTLYSKPIVDVAKYHKLINYEDLGWLCFFLFLFLLQECSSRKIDMFRKLFNIYSWSDEILIKGVKIHSSAKIFMLHALSSVLVFVPSLILYSLWHEICCYVFCYRQVNREAPLWYTSNGQWKAWSLVSLRDPCFPGFFLRKYWIHGKFPLENLLSVPLGLQLGNVLVPYITQFSVALTNQLRKCNWKDRWVCFRSQLWRLSPSSFGHTALGLC